MYSPEWSAYVSLCVYVGLVEVCPSECGNNKLRSQNGNWVQARWRLLGSAAKLASPNGASYIFPATYYTCCTLSAGENEAQPLATAGLFLMLLWL